MKPEPTPRDGTTRGWICMPGPFGMPKRFRNSLSGLSSSSESIPAVFVVPIVLMLTTAAPSRATSVVKSGSRAAALDATGDVTAGGETAALASDNAGTSSLLYPAPTARPKPAAASATVSCFKWNFACMMHSLGNVGPPGTRGWHRQYTDAGLTRP